MSTESSADLTTANTPLTQPENRVHYPALDGLRALALLMVFCQHYLNMPWGYTGVDLFFVLSGFLITGILFDSVDRPDRVRTFFVRRALRIFPLYYGMLLLLLLLTPLLHIRWSAWWWVWPAYLGNMVRFVHPYALDPAYLAGANGWLHYGRAGDKVLFLGHLWSLCLEEQFYLLWPWVVFLVRRRRVLVWICGLTVVVMPVARVVTMFLLPPRYTQLELPYSFTPLRLDALLIGGLLALMIRGQHRNLVLWGARWLLAAAVPLVAFCLWHTVHRGQPYPYRPWRLTWGQSVLDVLYTAVVATALVPGNPLYRLCSLRALRRVGQISYGAYVFHDIPHGVYLRVAVALMAHLAPGVHHDRTVTALLAAVGTLLLAWLSYRYFEGPLLNLKERWAPSGGPRVVAVPRATHRAT